MGTIMLLEGGSMAASTEVVDTTAWKQALFFKLHQIELKAPRMSDLSCLAPA